MGYCLLTLSFKIRLRKISSKYLGTGYRSRGRTRIKYLVFVCAFLCLILCIFIFLANYLHSSLAFFLKYYSPPSSVCVAKVLDPTLTIFPVPIKKLKIPSLC